jgi:succinoglycan biosynthesis transport protein ExoP
MERTYGLHDLAAALRRRRSLALLVAAVVLVGGVVIAFAIPSEYSAESVVQIEPHRLPVDYFPAQSATPFEDRMRTLKHGILARPVLERVVRETDFFPDMRDDLDGAVERMRRAVEVRLEGEVAGGPPSLLFVVQVRGRDAAKVAKAAELLPRYYAEMTRDVLTTQAHALRSVLDAQAAALAKALADGEDRLVAFKTKHATELPEAIDANMRGAARAQALMELRLGALADARRRRAAILATAPEAASATGLAEAAADLALRKYEAARAGYGPEHPDVKRAKRELDEAIARRDEAVGRYRSQRIDPQVAAIDEEVQDARTSLEEAKAELASYTKRMEAAPRWGAELASMARDYESIRAKYVTTVARRADAEAAESLLQAEGAGLFRVLQPAVAPTRPYAPDRGKLLWIALAAAIAAALGAAALAEWSDGSVRGPEDAAGLGAPVLATIPRIGTRTAR